MTELSKYLEIAANKQHCGSYYAVAKHLGIPASSVYRARDTGQLADYHCVELAKVIGANPLVLIASKNVDTERDGKRRSVWREVLTEAESNSKDYRKLELKIALLRIRMAHAVQVPVSLARVVMDPLKPSHTGFPFH